MVGVGGVAKMMLTFQFVQKGKYPGYMLLPCSGKISLRTLSKINLYLFPVLQKCWLLPDSLHLFCSVISYLSV